MQMSEGKGKKFGDSEWGLIEKEGLPSVSLLHHYILFFFQLWPLHRLLRRLSLEIVFVWTCLSFGAQGLASLVCLCWRANIWVFTECMIWRHRMICKGNMSVQGEDLQRCSNWAYIGIDHVHFGVMSIWNGLRWLIWWMRCGEGLLSIGHFFIYFGKESPIFPFYDMSRAQKVTVSCLLSSYNSYFVGLIR